MEIYSIPQEVKDRLIIDIQPIPNITISNFDDYAIHFRKSQVLVYKHLKYSKDSVKLSYLHERYYTQFGKFFKLNLKEIEDNETIYAKVIQKNVRDDYSWSTSGWKLTSAFFDRSKLKMFDVREKAIDCTSKLHSKTIRHWSGNITDLFKYRSRRYHKYHEERLNLIEDLYSNYILKNVDIHENIKIATSSNKIEFTNTKNSEYYIRILIGEFKFGYIDIDIMSERGSISNETKKRLILAKFASKYSCFGSIINNLEDCSDQVLNYLKQLKELSNKYRFEIEQNKLIITSILSELKNNDKFGYVNKPVKFVSINSRDNIQVLNCFVSNKNDKVRYSKVIHHIEDNEICQETGSYTANYYNNNLTELAEYLIEQGYINAYHTNDEPDLTDYLALLTNQTALYNHLTFRLTFSEVSKICDSYFTEVEELINKRYTEGNVDDTLKQLAEPDRIKYSNYFEERYSEIYDDYERLKTVYKKLQIKKLNTDLKYHIKTTAGLAKLSINKNL